MDIKKLYVGWPNQANGKLTESVPRTLDEFNESPYKDRSTNICECVRKGESCFVCSEGQGVGSVFSITKITKDNHENQKLC